MLLICRQIQLPKPIWNDYTLADFLNPFRIVAKSLMIWEPVAGLHLAQEISGEVVDYWTYSEFSNITYLRLRPDESDYWFVDQKVLLKYPNLRGVFWEFHYSLVSRGRETAP